MRPTKKKRIDVIKLVYFLDYNTCILGFGSLQVIPFCTNLVLANQGQLNDIAVVSYSFRKDEYSVFNTHSPILFRPLILGKKRLRILSTSTFIFWIHKSTKKLFQPESYIEKELNVNWKKK